MRRISTLRAVRRLPSPLALAVILTSFAFAPACGSSADPAAATPGQTAGADAGTAPPSGVDASAPGQDAAGPGPSDSTGPTPDAPVPPMDASVDLLPVGSDTPTAEDAPATPDVVVPPDVIEPPANDPGRVTLHRLNRAEYNNTVRDLLGTERTPAQDFPNDDHGYGFDNIAAVLAVSPLLFELYERAAEALVDEALFIPPTEPVTFYMEAEEAVASTGGPSSGGWNIWSNGTVSALFDLPHDGTYRVSASAFGQQAGPDLVHMAFLVDGLVVGAFDVPNAAGSFETFEVEVPLSAGVREVAIAFTNDYYEPDAGLDRNLVVDWFQVLGPIELLEEAPTNPLRAPIVTCDPAEDAAVEAGPCAREIITGFGRRAWRRPLTDGEVEQLAGFLDVAAAEGEGFEAGIRLALRAILTSPHFVFRVEIDPEPTSLEPHPLDPHEVATRLSYFLWSSMPDAELFAAVDAGQLETPAQIAAQARRMLADPRATALIDNFAGQWLYLRALDDAAPDPWYYPGWNEELRASMKREGWLFVRSILLGDRDMLELLTSPKSFIDARLAAHYGIDGFSTPEAAADAFVEMDVSPWGRGGFLRQGGIQATLSYPTRTSPVRRGKWVLGQLLCQEPPPPPPGVEGIADEVLEGQTIREVMEQHRADPVCAGCHTYMDPIGLGLENFDGIGQWRNDYPSGFPVDATGVLPPDQAFSTPEQLIGLLAADPSLTWCMTEQLWTYGLGRGPTVKDHAYMQPIHEAFVASGRRFEELVVEIVTSEPFRMRRGETEEVDQ